MTFKNGLSLTSLLYHELTIQVDSTFLSMSFDKELAGLCGLTQADVAAALEKICTVEADIASHLKTLSMYTNAYHFCYDQKTEPVFNTDTSLEHLHVSL